MTIMILGDAVATADLLRLVDAVLRDGGLLTGTVGDA